MAYVNILWKPKYRLWLLKQTQSIHKGRIWSARYTNVVRETFYMILGHTFSLSGTALYTELEYSIEKWL